MAHVSAIGGLSPLLYNGSGASSRNLRKFPVPTSLGGRILRGRQGQMSTTSKAVDDSSESSSESIVKYVQNAWDNSEDRIALAGLGFAAIAVLWASSTLITAIDKLPLIPSILEFIGVLFSWWFIYRYLLFKPDSKMIYFGLSLRLSRVIEFFPPSYIVFAQVSIQTLFNCCGTTLFPGTLTFLLGSITMLACSLSLFTWEELVKNVKSSFSDFWNR